MQTTQSKARTAAGRRGGSFMIAPPALPPLHGRGDENATRLSFCCRFSSHWTRSFAILALTESASSPPPRHRATGFWPPCDLSLGGLFSIRNLLDPMIAARPLEHLRSKESCRVIGSSGAAGLPLCHLESISNRMESSGMSTVNRPIRIADDWIASGKPIE
jgi:hypothetical protein